MRLSRSTAVFGFLVAYLVGVKLSLGFWPGVFRSPAQAAVFGWPYLALWVALGYAGVLLSRRTGFPEPWNGGASNRRRLVLPLVLGVAFGILAIGVDLATHWTDFVARKMGLPTIHIAFPASAIVYPGGAIIVEILYRLFPIPRLLWLVSTVLLRGRRQSQTFWILAAATSLVEPMGDLGLAPLGIPTVAAVFGQDYALNLAQAWLFRRLGFLASILMRVFFYLVWHVLGRW